MIKVENDSLIPKSSLAHSFQPRPEATANLLSITVD